MVSVVLNAKRTNALPPVSRGLQRVDDRRVISGIIYVIRYALQWKDAPPGYGPPKTLYNRFIRWIRLGVFACIFAALAAKGGAPARLMIDATHLKAHRTAASLLQKGVLDVLVAPKAEQTRGSGTRSLLEWSAEGA